MSRLIIPAIELKNKNLKEHFKIYSNHTEDFLMNFKNLMQILKDLGKKIKIKCLLI